MIGTVLHLMGRVVDRVGDALEPDAMASLRVMLAALSARVVAAEGEVERLRGELTKSEIACGHALKVEAAATAKVAVERDEARADVAAVVDDCTAALGLLATVRKERDEARAEVERLRGLVRAYKAAEDAYYAAKGDARTPARAALHEAVDALFAAVPKEAP